MSQLLGAPIKGTSTDALNAGTADVQCVFYAGTGKFDVTKPLGFLHVACGADLGPGVWGQRTGNVTALPQADAYGAVHYDSLGIAVRKNDCTLDMRLGDTNPPATGSSHLTAAIKEAYEALS